MQITRYFYVINYYNLFLKHFSRFTQLLRRLKRYVFLFFDLASNTGEFVKLGLMKK